MTAITVPRFAAAFVAAAALATGTAGVAGAATAGSTSTAASTSAGASGFVVIAEHGRTSLVASEVTEQGGSIVRSLPDLDTLVVDGVSATVLRADAHVLSVSPDVKLSGRSMGWGDDVPELDTSTASPSAPLSTTSSQTSLAAPLAESASVSGVSSAVPTSVVNTVSLSQAEDAIQARQAWHYATGKGVDVALIDTGIAPVQGLTSPGKVINGPDLSFESQAAGRSYVDNNGHGTHMAGIIAANDLGATANPTNAGSSSVEGVAPGSRLVNVKVGDGNGVTDVSQVLAGIDWVVQHAHDPSGAPGGLNIRVLNLSYGTDSTQSATIDPLAHAAEVAWRNGIVVVAAAGNDGNTKGRLSDPAIDPYLIAVGAADTDFSTSASGDTVPSFSSRGDGVRNPDVVAPGVHIASLLAPGSEVATAYGDAAGVGTRLIRGSGTSQSTAMVSGAAAVLLSARPYLTPDQVKSLLMHSARGVSGAGARDQGSGLISVYKALSTRAGSATQQYFPASVGGGSLDASRGTHIVTLDGVPLTGEQDIFGVAFDAAAVASSEESLTGWAMGTWNGSVWSGSSWAGSSWAGSSWAGSSWAGSSWAGSSWAGSSWAGSSWAGSSWAGGSWADPSPVVTPAPAAAPTSVPTTDPTSDPTTVPTTAPASDPAAPTDPAPSTAVTSTAPASDPSPSSDPAATTPDPAPSVDTSATDPSAAGGGS
ncbi:MAG TPA: S8 family serine peptidase [Frankiaceae bacterium]|nr:S8 family serine peptidase [Frankiaceae bacterium]